MSNILFFDIDNTLTTFEHSAGVSRLVEYLRINSHLRNAHLIGREVNRMFNCISTGTIRAEELRYLLLNTQVAALSEESFSSLKWSRELWVLQACRKHNFTIPSRELQGAVRAYWDAIKEVAILFSDARGILRWCQNAPWKLVFVSSSDGVLKLADGGPKSFTSFVYDAEYAIRHKKQRLPQELLAYTPHIFIGDPVSKPEPAFWRNVLQTLNYQHGRDLAVMVGDSYKSDICNLGRFGIHGVLLDREVTSLETDVLEAEFIIHDLTELIALLPAMEQARGSGKEGAA